VKEYLNLLILLKEKMDNRRNNNPWRGLAPYDGSEDPNLFCGRKDEKKRLRQLIEDNACVTFYGASGVGKTSLLKAGVMPMLKLYSYLPVYIRLSEIDGGISFAQAIMGRLGEYAIANDESEKSHAFMDGDKSWVLWNYFYRTRFVDASHEVIPVVILDQFEEVLRGVDKERAELLLLQIFTLINGRSNMPQGHVDFQSYRFVISMREDFLFALEDSIDRLGLTLLKNARFRLRPLSKEQAKQVVTICPYLLPKIEEERNHVIETLIKSATQDGEVSTLLISLLCYRAYELKQRDVIDMGTVKELGERPLKKFCDEVLKELNPKAVDFIVQKTVDDNGFRLPVGLNMLKSNKVPSRFWNDRNAKRFFVKTSRKGIGADSTDSYYELLHDQLALALLDYRSEIEVRKEREGKEKLQIVQSRFIAEKANQLVDDGNSYFAIRLLLEVLPKNLLAPKWPYTEEAEGALRKASKWQFGVFKGHTGWVNSVFFSPDGKRIVSASDDQSVRIWDVEKGRQIECLNEGHFASFSPDGKRIVLASKDYTIRIWDVETCQRIGLLKGHTDTVMSVFFSPDGKRIVSASKDYTIRIWDVEARQQIGRPLEGHTGMVLSASFSPDGRRIVSSSKDCTIRIWNVETGLQVGPPLEGHTSMVRSASFDCDGKRVVSASADHTLRIWDTETGRQIGFPMKGHTDWVNSATFHPDGEHIVSASFDNTVRIWYVKTGRQIGQPLEGHTASFSSDGKHFVSASKSVYVWNFPPLQELINKYRKQFKNKPLSAEEKDMYYIE
jgi:WD40 repeat protein